MVFGIVWTLSGTKKLLKNQKKFNSEKKNINNWRFWFLGFNLILKLKFKNFEITLISRRIPFYLQNIKK